MARVSSSSSTLGQYIQQVWEARGTDLLLTSGVPPLIRVDQKLRPIEGEPALRPADTERLVLSALTESQAADLANRLEIDFSFSWEEKARFRGNAFHQRDSLALALRLIPFEIPTMEQLGLPAIVQEMVSKPSGLVLVTGPTGSGKSTTLAAAIDYINQNRQSHILTIEDPIEYVHHHKLSAVNQREVGTDTESFARALRSCLREDPDVLMCGEMRDLESIDIALTMAETGHLVFATLHTNDTSQAIDRVVGVFPAERQDQIRIQLASTLNGVIYQRLMPRLGGGLAAAFEVLMGTHAVRNLIREGKTRQLRNAITMGQSEGMQTIEMSLSELVKSGTVDYDEALLRSLYPKDVFKPAAQGNGNGAVLQDAATS
ncbi:MAG TPA: type IV pilus twitching motility protein PilT [Acidimicrobiales bacterium]|nr:type IV pilus twitching motility protein PilT [Acidimicrobiales bacterium]